MRQAWYTRANTPGAQGSLITITETPLVGRDWCNTEYFFLPDCFFSKKKKIFFFF
jgi:hypothetical protein